MVFSIIKKNSMMKINWLRLNVTVIILIFCIVKSIHRSSQDALFRFRYVVVVLYTFFSQINYCFVK